MRFNETILAFSPLVNFTGSSWTSGASIEFGDIMSFQFEGTAITAFGVVDSNFTRYQVVLDDEDPIVFDGTTNAETDMVLFASKALNQGVHTLQISNLYPKGTPKGRGALMPSTLTWEMEIGDDDTTVTQIDDRGIVEQLEYGPSSAFWEPYSCISEYFGGGCHLTKRPNAFVSYTFNGSAISVFGGTNANHGNYLVQLDELDPVMYTGFTPGLSVNQLLAHFVVSPDVEHKIILTNVPDNLGGFCLDIDYFQVYANPVPPATTTSTPATSTMGTLLSTGGAATQTTSTAPPLENSQTIIIVPSILGSVALLSLAVYAWLCCRKRYSHHVHLDAVPEPWQLPQMTTQEFSQVLFDISGPGKGAPFTLPNLPLASSDMMPPLIGGTPNRSFDAAAQSDEYRILELDHGLIVPPAYRKIDFTKRL